MRLTIDGTNVWRMNTCNSCNSCRAPSSTLAITVAWHRDTYNYRHAHAYANTHTRAHTLSHSCTCAGWSGDLRTHFHAAIACQTRSPAPAKCELKSEVREPPHGVRWRVQRGLHRHCDTHTHTHTHTHTCTHSKGCSPHLRAYFFGAIPCQTPTSAPPLRKLQHKLGEPPQGTRRREQRGSTRPCATHTHMHTQ